MRSQRPTSAVCRWSAHKMLNLPLLSASSKLETQLGKPSSGFASSASAGCPCDADGVGASSQSGWLRVSSEYPSSSLNEVDMDGFGGGASKFCSCFA